MYTNGIVYLFVEFLATAHIMRSKSATHPIGFQICMQALGKGLVF